MTLPAAAFCLILGVAASQQQPNWTFETLHEDLQQQIVGVEKRSDQKFEASEKAVNAALAAAEKAVNAALVAADRAVAKAESAAEKRFDATNEFRAQQKDLIVQLLPRPEAEARFRALEDRVTRAEQAQTAEVSTANGKASISGPMWAFLGAIVTLILGGIILAWISKGIDRRKT